MRLLRMVLILALATAGFADVITLKNGRVINGTYLGGSARELKVQIGDSIENFDVSQVAKIEFGNGNSAPSAPADRPVLRRQGGDRSSSDDGRPTLRRDPSASSDDQAPPQR